METLTEEIQDDSSYVKFSNIPFAEPPVGSLRFKAPVPPRKRSKDVNLGLKERVCPQYQVGWVPKAFEFLNCYAGALIKPPSCSLNDNWTEPIDSSDYPSFDGSGFIENCNSRPFPSFLLAKSIQLMKIAYCWTYSFLNQSGITELKVCFIEPRFLYW